MPKPISFAQAKYDAKRKTTRWDRFLAGMKILVPWARPLKQLSTHYYPEAGQGPGREPIGLGLMFRLYYLQHWFGLADDALEDAVYDSQPFRGFLGLELSRKARGTHVDFKAKWYIAAKRGQVAALPEGEVKALTKRIERFKAQARSRVEHVFHLIKDRFHYRNLR